VLVFSEQGHNLRHFSGRLCRHMGTYAQEQAIATSQSKLYDEILHEDQVVWCSPDRPEIIPLEEPKYLHTIELDSRDLVAMLDGFVWEHIIGNSRCIPPEIHKEMRFSCCSADGNSRHRILRALEDRYISENLPKDPWSHVVVKDAKFRMPVFLLKWPFVHSQVVDVEEILERTSRSS
jgi:hypothetical protein